jgi:hypothetical protein
MSGSPLYAIRENNQFYPIKTIVMDTSKSALIEQAKETGAAFVDTLASFSDEQFNIQPAYGGWTAGQVAEHMILSGGVAQVVTGRTVATADRQPDAYCPMIAGIFLDFTTKLQSPDFIVPAGGYHDKQDHLEKLRGIWDKIGEDIARLDLSVTCLDFEFPTVGHLTRLEWLWFYVWHTQRHLRQVQKIYGAVAGVPA